MHGQKKRRKRTLSGAFRLDDLLLDWTLVSEPQWSNSTQQSIGLRVLVRVADAARRELLIEFPFPRSPSGARLFLPQRPSFRSEDVREMARLALAEGWDPESRGRVYRFDAPGLDA